MAPFSASLSASPAGSSLSGVRRPGWAGGWLGFALGGFFDGILLHQILQWHHLLSALEGPRFADLRVQVLADGLFHALMYVIALAGLWLLWRSRATLAAQGAGRAVTAGALLGFGLWHVVDAVLSHWLLGIHRVRMDSEVPLLWDLLWVAVFGVGAMALGLWVGRRGGSGGGSGNGSGGDAGRRRGAVAATLLALLVLAAGPLAALPPPGATGALVLFRPGLSDGEILGAVAALDGRVLWADSSRSVWAIDLAEPRRADALYRSGALFVSSGLLPGGCLAWVRGPAPQRRG
ncbi:DUF2243 domain-containing protein [Azospirillum thermophilum]|uniref:DUF2243 domain-containing protein n=1 Tax=Azospirillum thermophilum TaxID=2202148 RepID=A0A2S2CSS3_9PROT|nr:DUF2243 domain-containing protein [Azospirillum thermophilum]AWK87337.1 DUF2243 domain-containing protein [Azospirillum thermophilum]